MLDLQTPLFQGQWIRLGEIDYEKDPAVESGWTHDAEFMRLLEPGPAYPLSPDQIKKRYEALDKQMEDEHNLFPFRIRAREDDRLVGIATLEWVDWSNGNAFLKLGIGSPADRGRGWGREALQLALRYAFNELNLFRVTVLTQEYNTAAIHLLTGVGFLEEARRRQACFRDSRCWDLIYFGLLKTEWKREG
jgi:RimJ/RimL family protein N-acetyltransferase